MVQSRCSTWPPLHPRLFETEWLAHAPEHASDTAVADRITHVAHLEARLVPALARRKITHAMRTDGTHASSALVGLSVGDQGAVPHGLCSSPGSGVERAVGIGAPISGRAVDLDCAAIVEAS